MSAVPTFPPRVSSLWSWWLRRLMTVAAALVLLVGTAAAADPTYLTSAASATTGLVQERPNIVLITTDDQRMEDLRWMPHTRELLGGHGVEFTGALSPHPLCCPARAEWVSGQYGQNNGVQHNRGPHGGYQALKDPSNTLGRWLHDSGYQTAMVGKYMNGYQPDAESQVGWTHWNPSIGRRVYSYTGTTFFNDASPVKHRDHVDDVVTDYAAGYIDQFSGEEAPFFVWASNLAPHAAIIKGEVRPPIAAARHQALFSKAVNPSSRKPSYARSIVDGQAAKLHGEHLAAMTQKHIDRIRSLQAVDEGVRAIVTTLRRTGELDDTYIVFTSDNGYLLGEHGLVAKNYIYEEALRVPLLVRVPGHREASTSAVPVTLVDLAPTIADLARAIPERVVDGISFAPHLAGPDRGWRDTQLIQTGTESITTAEPGWELRGVRTDRWTYAASLRDGGEQLYDRLNDPFQTVNLANRPEYLPVLTDLRHRTAVLKSCSGEGCSQPFGAVTEPLPSETDPWVVAQAPTEAPTEAPTDAPAEADTTPRAVRVPLAASSDTVRLKRHVQLVVKAPRPIRTVTWWRLDRAGRWRVLATDPGSSRKATKDIAGLSQPGRQTFRVTVAFKAGSGVSNRVVVRTTR